MSAVSGAGENTPQPRRRRRAPGREYHEVDALVDDLAELSTLSPVELRRYCGNR